MESEESVRQCSVVAGPAAAPVTQCRSRVVEAPREVCADTEVTEARELCQEVTRMEEKITCDTHMKQIEIKVNKTTLILFHYYHTILYYISTFSTYDRLDFRFYHTVCFI